MFTGLLTITNERGEIRVCCLVATKSHAQFKEALRKLLDSLRKYGLEEPLIFYTDNVNTDRQFLMNIFPSLSKDVTPSDKYQDLPDFALPSTVTIHILKTESDINSTFEIINTDILREHGAADSPSPVLGFDVEWNVKFGANDRVIGRGTVAVIQVAYKDSVYVLQVR